MSYYSSSPSSPLFAVPHSSSFDSSSPSSLSSSSSSSFSVYRIFLWLNPCSWLTYQSNTSKEKYLEATMELRKLEELIHDLVMQREQCQQQFKEKQQEVVDVLSRNGGKTPKHMLAWEVAAKRDLKHLNNTIALYTREIDKRERVASTYRLADLSNKLSQDTLRMATLFEQGGFDVDRLNAQNKKATAKLVQLQTHIQSKSASDTNRVSGGDDIDDSGMDVSSSSDVISEEMDAIDDPIFAMCREEATRRTIQSREVSKSIHIDQQRDQERSHRQMLEETLHQFLSKPPPSSTKKSVKSHKKHTRKNISTRKASLSPSPITHNKQSIQALKQEGVDQTDKVTEDTKETQEEEEEEEPEKVKEEEEEEDDSDDDEDDDNEEEEEEEEGGQEYNKGTKPRRGELDHSPDMQHKMSIADIAKY